MKKLTIIKLITSSLCVISLFGAYYYKCCNEKNTLNATESYQTKVGNLSTDKSDTSIPTDASNVTEYNIVDTDASSESETPAPKLLKEETNNKPATVANAKKPTNAKPDTTKPTNTIKENTTVSSSKVGFIRGVYEENGSLYISFDEAQFFTGAATKDEYIKDHGAPPILGSLENDYYIRNKDTNTKTYKLSSNVNTRLCKFLIEPGSTTSHDSTLQVSLDTFKHYIHDHMSDNPNNRAVFFWIDTNSEGTVLNARMQYTP